MKIISWSITKLDHNDPRYPAADALKRADGTVVPFVDVVLCQCETDDGAFECAQFVNAHQAADPEYIGGILMCAGAAIKRMCKTKISEAA